METESREINSGQPACVADDTSSFVHVDTDDVEANDEEVSTESCVSVPSQALFQMQEDDDGESDDDVIGTNDIMLTEKSETKLQRCEHHGERASSLPDTFQTNHLLFYERFKAYQDYLFGDCKPSEVKAFIADYLEKVVEPCDWLAVWTTDVFDVLLEVRDVLPKDLKAVVKLALPLQCDTRGCELSEEAMNSLLEATQHQIPLQDLHVVYEESGDFDQTAIALEHLRFFYKHIWMQWDDEDEDDDFDYFVRCVEPRLRLYYDIMEERVPAGLVAEYQSLLEKGSQCFQHFSALRNILSTDSDSELDNVSFVEGLKLCDELEMIKRKLHIIENPLLRYVLGYKGNARQHLLQSRGPRSSGVKVVHVVAASCSTIQLQSLLSARLQPLCSCGDTEIQFHREPVSAVDSSHQGDVVIVLPGIYNVDKSIFIPDSITVEGFGFPDDVVIEKKSKGDTFVESTGADVRLSNIKLIQHDAIEGILCVRQGCLNMENCVLQCETTGVTVQTSAHLNMERCDLYGSKGAGLELYPGSVCRLISNGIHHCKDGILIKDFAEELDVMPTITMENNVIHNNEGYGVIVVKPIVGAHHRVPLETGQDDCVNDRPTAEDEQDDGASDPQLMTTTTTSSATPSQCSSTAPQSKTKESSTDGDSESVPDRRWFTRQLSRNKETSSRAVQDLMDHQIFISNQGNQFKRNGMGDFGTFFY